MRRRAIAALLATTLALPALAAAQDELLPMVWLRYYKARPGMVNDFSQQVENNTAPMLDGLLAEGSILGWGLAVPFTFTGENDWTHVLWIAMADWDRADELVAAVEAAGEAIKVEDAAAYESTLEPGTRRDTIIRHLMLPGEMAEPEGGPTSLGYIRITYYKARPGKAAEMVALYQEIGRPVFEQLTAEGVVGPCGISAQEVITDPAWTHMAWHFTADLAGIGRVNRELQAAMEAQGNGLTERFERTSEPEAYRSQILRVVLAGGPQPAGSPPAGADEAAGEAPQEPSGEPSEDLSEEGGRSRPQSRPSPGP